MKKEHLKISLIILMMGGIVLIGVLRRASLNKNNAISIGYINDVQTSSKGGGAFVKFNFILDNKNFRGNTPIPISNIKEYQFLNMILKGESLPIIYQRNFPENNVMLFQRKDYKKYNISLAKQQEVIIDAIDSIIKLHE